MNRVCFVRAFDFIDFYKQVLNRYRLAPEQLSIPPQVFKDSMSLVPLNELSKLYEELDALVPDHDFVINTMADLPINRLGSLGRWVLSATDFAMCLRRLSNGMPCTNSGANLSTAIVGNIVKWTYTTTSLSNIAQIHDSIRHGLFLLKIMQYYLGEDYKPHRVFLCGYRDNSAVYEDIFGCDVTWGSAQSEIWFPSHYRFLPFQTQSRLSSNLAMTYSDLDNLLDMPNPDDSIKTISELIKYSRHYGFPTISRVSTLAGCSIQQLQRELTKRDLSYRVLSGHVLSHFAIEQMLLGHPPKFVAESIGYDNVASFNRMFKNQRGLTPKQFLGQIE
ncbi:AraC family transcriptional regulator [Vibrio sp. CB1-14]|uniref:AraC family transcriptional regulator ligand-binding domain-containing protein n=1 Tax=Vibrio chaetopteri TaxID=3016528 RepID=A0AAU8BF81_9VIBR